MIRSIWNIVWCIFSFHAYGVAQSFDQFFPKFYTNGKELTLGTIGGLRNPQFSNIDFNNDGIKDLFVFDRTGDKVLCFVNQSSSEEISYVYAPEYESSFPKLQSWAILHDYNKDGIEDIFCQPLDIGISGIQVWKGSRVNGKLFYRLMQLPFQNTMSVPLSFDPSKSTNLYNAITDIPAIIDVDNDGDTDVLTFDPDGSQIVFYNNLSKERGFGMDTFIMETRDRCYGKVYESMFSSELYFSTDGISCATGNISTSGGPRHSGSTVMAFDEDCDGDKDLLLGDISNTNIVFLRNTGTIENSWITYQDLVYPKMDPVDLFIFNATFLLDVNNDNKKDLIVVPNETDGGVNHDHIWLYLNEGSNCNPSFKLYTKNFLVDQMVSLGSNSNVTFLDVNADGLKDLLVSGSGINKSREQKLNKIFFFKNTGSKTVPEFTLMDDNYLNMANITQFAMNLFVTAGDADGDADDDVMVGTSNGNIYYFENIAGANKPILFAPFVFPFMNLAFGSDVAPHLYDIDGDGLNDLLAGEKNNSLNYFKNFGTKGNTPMYNMNPITDDFGHIFKFFGYNTWNSNPFMTKNADGKEIAVVGFNDGRVSYYERKKTPTTDSLLLVSERMGNIFAGRKSAPELYDIDCNGYFDLVLGNFRGGISFYHTPVKAKLVNAINDLPDYSFNLYPNPATDKIVINISKGLEYKYNYAIYSILGRSVKEGELAADGTINLASLQAGYYTLLIRNQNNRAVSKSFVKL